MDWPQTQLLYEGAEFWSGPDGSNEEIKAVCVPDPDLRVKVVVAPRAPCAADKRAPPEELVVDPVLVSFIVAVIDDEFTNVCEQPTVVHDWSRVVLWVWCRADGETIVPVQPQGVYIVQVC